MAERPVEAGSRTPRASHLPVRAESCAGLPNRRRVRDDTGMDLKRPERRVGSLGVLLLFLVLFLPMGGVRLMGDRGPEDSQETEFRSVVQLALAIVLLIATTRKRLSAVLCRTAAIRRPGLPFANFPTTELKRLACLRI